MASRILSLSVFCLFFITGIHAQDFNDALRYSNFQVGGTARSIGVGGSLGALGADFSVLSTNPAGLGWFRRSEFVIGPTFYNANTTGQLTNDPESFPNEESRTNFNLNTFGVVVAGNPTSPDWKTFNFGIGLNRLANFNQDLYYEGQSVGSLINTFQEQANGPQGIDDFESGIAIDAEALYDLEPQDGFFETDFELARDALINRSQTVEERGAINELVFSFAGNYKERILLGATIGIPFLNFEQEKTYREEDPIDVNSVPFFEELSYTERLATTGVGINAKLGLAYRASQSVRLGFAVHTPTAFKLEDNFSTAMAYTYTTTQDGSGSVIEGQGQSPDGLFDYKLRTPWRLIGSAGFIYKKAGFLSAEVEYVDYSGSNFRYDGFIDAERDANASISTELESALNIRLGAELAYEIFRFRAGLRLQQSPYFNEDDMNTTLSGGLGIRGRSFFLDLAYQRRTNEEFFIPFQAASGDPEQVASLNSNFNRLAFTLGFKF